LFIQQKRIDVTEIKLPSLLAEFVKRLIDIIGSFFVCLTILPVLYLILGAVIKLTSAGPIIFRQNRIGIFGIMFPCYKFRSMYQNSVEKVAVRGDARVTPVGRFIRKTHLDEFPQFYNVLIGDMSLVGPRPTIRFVADGLDQHPQYIYRVLVRPGITGISQINGRPEKQVTMLKFDFEYLKSQSLWNDLKIIFQTLKFKDDSY
jgi:putative colanic acid biosynthesis UDP-glucose lipid carrier transferase